MVRLRIGALQGNVASETRARAAHAWNVEVVEGPVSSARGEIAIALDDGGGVLLDGQSRRVDEVASPQRSPEAGQDKAARIPGQFVPADRPVDAPRPPRLQARQQRGAKG